MTSIHSTTYANPEFAMQFELSKGQKYVHVVSEWMTPVSLEYIICIELLSWLESTSGY